MPVHLAKFCRADRVPGRNQNRPDAISSDLRPPVTWWARIREGFVGVGGEARHLEMPARQLDESSELKGLSMTAAKTLACSMLLHVGCLAMWLAVARCAAAAPPADSWPLLNGPITSSMRPPVANVAPAFPVAAAAQDEFCASDEQLSASIKPLSAIPLDISPPAGRLPPDCYAQRVRLELEPPYPTEGPRTSWHHHVHWTPSGLAHFPTYLEDVPLERYGQGYAPLVQPVVSGVRFYGGVLTLPYRMGVEPPYRPIYDLGYERSGSAVPAVKEHLPWSWPGTLWQAGSVAGAALMLP